MDSSATHRLMRQIRQLIRTPAQDPVSDRQLLQQFADLHDEAAFRILVDRHGPLVLGVSRRLLGDAHEAEDVFQATFLVLARKAGARRWRVSVGPWLYQVAYRLALKTRTDLSRQRTLARQIQPGPVSEPEAEVSRRELARVLDEEVQRLPARYRLPIVLCYLEGQSNATAAEQLGCRVSTLKGRLARARALLRSRLSRRGVALAAGAVLPLLPEGLTSAAVPGSLAVSTARIAALLLTTEPAGCGGASAVVTRLAEGMLHAMWVSKVKAAVAVMLVLVLAGGAGLLAHQAFVGKADEEMLAPPPNQLAQELGRAKESREKLVRSDRYGDPLPAGALARLGTVRLRHGTGRPAVAFAPDGKVFAASHYNSICLRDLATGKERPPAFPRFPGGVHCLVYSPDGKMLMAGAGDTVHILEAATGKEIRQFKVQHGSVAALALTPDGKVLATGSGEWNKSAELILWDPVHGVKIRSLQGHAQDITTLAFSPDGKLLASGSKDKTVRLWDTGNGREVRQLTGWEREVNAVAFSADGRFIAAVGEDRKQRIRLWDLSTGRELLQFKGNTAFGHFIVFSRDGQTIWVGSSNQIYAFEVASGKELRRLGGHQGWITSLALSPDGKVLAAAGGDNTLSLWKAATGEPFYPFQGHQGGVGSVTFSPDRQLVATADWGTVRIWEPAAGKLLQEFPVGGGSWFNTVAFSPDGKFLAYGSCNGPRRVWEVATWKQVFLGPDPDSRAGFLAFSPDGKVMASGEGYDDLTVRLWDAATGKLLRQCVGHQDRVYGVAFLPDGQMLISGSLDKTARLWKTATGEEIRQFRDPGGKIECMAISPDGKTLATGTWKDPIRLWEVATGKERGQLAGHGWGIRTLCFSPNGQFLASGSADQHNTIRLWRVNSCNEWGRLRGHRSQVNALAFAPDGKTLVSGSSDSTALIWDLDQILSKKPLPDVSLQDAELERLWTDLAAADAARAFHAIGTLCRAPRQAVEFLHKHVRPAPSADLKSIGRLIAALDSAEFRVRERAKRGLERLGDSAVPALRRAWQNGPSLEVQRRAEELLHTLERAVPSSEVLRELRSIEVLEQIGTPAARELVQTLAAGTPEARLTREAKAALGRLAQRVHQGK